MPGYGDPTSFSDFVSNYLLNESYWQEQTEQFSERLIPIVALKIGRRQFGLLGGVFGLLVGMTMKHKLREYTVGFVFSGINWFKTQISSVIGGFL